MVKELMHDPIFLAQKAEKPLKLTQKQPKTCWKPLLLTRKAVWVWLPI